MKEHTLEKGGTQIKPNLIPFGSFLNKKTECILIKKKILFQYDVIQRDQVTYMSLLAGLEMVVGATCIFRMLNLL